MRSQTSLGRRSSTSKMAIRALVPPISPARIISELPFSDLQSQRSFGLFQMSAELIAHRGEQLVGKIRRAARAEAFVERRAENVGGHALINSGIHRPSSLARIRNAP